MKLNPKELEILKIMWFEKKPFTASELYKYGDQALIMSTIQSTLKKLLQKGMIQIDGITYSGTVLTRMYVPAISLEEFLVREYPTLDVEKICEIKKE